MKKLILVLLVGLFIGTAAFADHPGTGIGAVVGGGWAFPYGYDPASVFYPGLSLKVPQLPIFWGFYASVDPYSVGFGVTADYYFIDRKMVHNTAKNDSGTYEVKIDWYLGLGLFSNVHFWSENVSFDIGARVPVGVSWHIVKQAELFIAVGPAVGIYKGNHTDLHFYPYGFGEIGIRYWWVK